MMPSQGSPPAAASLPFWNLSDSTSLTASNGRGATSSKAPTSSRRGIFSLHLKASTWAADSHGLFDYESRNVHGKIFKCNCLRDSYQVARIGTDVQLLTSEQARSLMASDPQAKFLAELAWSNGGFNLAPSQLSSTSGSPSPTVERLWLAVRTLKDRGVALTQGDVVRLGRYRLKVKEVVVCSDEAKELATRRFWCHGGEEDEDECETVAPDLIDAGEGEANANDATGQASSAVPQFNLSRAVGRYLPPLHHPPVDHFPPSAPATSPALGPRCLDDDGARSEPSSSSVRAKRSLTTKACRICLGDADDDEADEEANPLVAPCECKGSMKWVHLNCLRTWMAGRLNIRNDGTTVCFFWRSLECELCKVSYPPVVKVPDASDNEKDSDSTAKFRRRSDSTAFYGGKTPAWPRKAQLKRSKSASGARTIELFEIPRPDIPYAILEPRSQQCRGLHVVSLANNRVARLGRGHDTDIRLADISVSRLHAYLRFHPPPVKRNAGSTMLAGSAGIAGVPVSPHGCFVVEDNRSKFGTLLELRKPFRLDPNSAPVSVQVGRTVLTFSLKRRWRIRIPACIRQQSNDIVVLLQQTAPPATLTLPVRPSTVGALTEQVPENFLDHHDAQNEVDESHHSDPGASSSVFIDQAEGQEENVLPGRSASDSIQCDLS